MENQAAELEQNKKLFSDKECECAYFEEQLQANVLYDREKKITNLQCFIQEMVDEREQERQAQAFAESIAMERITELEKTVKMHDASMQRMRSSSSMPSFISSNLSLSLFKSVSANMSAATLGEPGKESDATLLRI